MWNYRIINKTDKKNITLGLYEVMYNDKEEIWLHAESPEELSGYEAAEDLRDSLLMMLSDVERHISGEKEILELDKIKFHELDEADTKTKNNDII